MASTVLFGKKCKRYLGQPEMGKNVSQNPYFFPKPKSDSLLDLDTRFSCIYGISDSVTQMAPGMAFSCYRKGSSCLTFTGLDGIAYWFVFKDLERTTSYARDRHLKFSAADQTSLVNEVLDCKVTDGVTFSDIFDRRRTALMTPLEEGVVKQWHEKRMVLMGDSAHKVGDTKNCGRSPGRRLT